MNFITGGNGFIGSHLIERIGGTVYDKPSDLLDLELLKKSMKGYDMVWHFGASSDIAEGNKSTDIDLKNNIIGTYNVLEAMRLNKIEKLVFASSATYYGHRDTDLYENLTPKPSSLYGASKVAGEALISAYSNLFGIKAWIFRFGNVVGGRMNHGILHDFIKKLRTNPKELEIIGDGTQQRPYFLVEDCIDGMMCALKHPPDTYNLGCSNYISVNEVARIVIKEMGLWDVLLKHTSRPAWDVCNVRLNMAKIYNLGWRPSHSSNEAVKIAVQRLL